MSSSRYQWIFKVVGGAVSLSTAVKLSDCNSNKISPTDESLRSFHLQAESDEVPLSHSAYE
ncbi:hypothetical protein PABG_11561 [Paracoccidioides brasiliensis Pb03]|uniref:Uncharacterized protein n=1 Tax=Paracoccidioides brasiliensis (strain Pb18) TaxID=502780 RepID=A0A0A0HWK6_PARBD|nr:uncharacterized protein PADG_11186 [Paracoccidioides brasiliensis Pb18]KGM92728.1 hypothetical protein PADG_11186 [Paracoccidioides brasiliensis Pb18]KGY15568.1 hypothetical protein PABG_11561 [Paracoccidioides brasiliensis Pb03]ODH46615.1 hypothetical protein GX48_07310 [Paracoccidioides brasiliensis]